MSAVAHGPAPSRLRRGIPDPVPLCSSPAWLWISASRDAGWATTFWSTHSGAASEAESNLALVPVVPVVVDVVDERAVGFCRHFDFHPLDEQRLWRRLNDIASAPGG